VQVTWYQPFLNSTTIYPVPGMTPTWQETADLISYANSLLLKVILKPHVDVLAGPWRGQIGSAFSSDAEFEAWFASYTSYMQTAATFATQANCFGFNIGTEFVGLSNRTSDWLAVIAAAKTQFTGPMLYGANWGDEPWQVQFWDKLDYIGVDAYYPMSDTPDPNATVINAHWATVLTNLSALSQKWGGKSIIFAEIGYRSVATAAIEPGTWQGNAPPDTQAQVDLWNGFFDNVWNVDWLAGVFPWSWDATMYQGGRCSNGYEIWGKPAVDVFIKYYNGCRLPRLSHSASEPITMYANGTTIWSDASWDATVNYADASNPFPTHQTSGVATLQSQGALSLRAAAPVNVSEYLSLQFDLRVDSTNTYTAVNLTTWLCTCDDCTACALRHQPVADWGQFATCSLSSNWTTAHIDIPLSYLGAVADSGYANSTQVQRMAIQFVGPNSTTVYFDNIQLL
jgi:hypothetical protein